MFTLVSVGFPSSSSKLTWAVVEFSAWVITTLRALLKAGSLWASK